MTRKLTAGFAPGMPVPQSAAGALAALLAVGLGLLPVYAVEPTSPAIVAQAFIADPGDATQVHAPTLVETSEGLVAAWFGGTREGHADVRIWVSRHSGGSWGPAHPVAEGRGADGERLPAWNPVLVQPRNGPLLLFYKVGRHPRSWWGMVRVSRDGGRTWSSGARLPDGYLGPIRAKPWETPEGALLMGSSTEGGAGWLAHLERYPAGRVARGTYSQWEGGDGLPADTSPWSLEGLASAAGWERTGTLNDPRAVAAIQPTILVHGRTHLRILVRTRQGVVGEAASGDGGDTWSRIARTAIPNPNAAIDAMAMPDGSSWLVYNPTAEDRSRLAIAIARPGGAWQSTLELEHGPGEYSYPAMIRAADGRVHVAYTWRRERIKQVVIDPAAVR